jgi:hypothetical protein
LKKKNFLKIFHQKTQKYGFLLAHPVILCGESNGDVIFAKFSIIMVENLNCGSGPTRGKWLYLPQMSADSTFYFEQGVFPNEEAIPNEK